MTGKEKIIKELKEALDSLDITNKYRLNLIRAIEYLQDEPISEELENAADIYGDELDNVLAVCNDNDDDNTVGEYAKEAFKAGAEWKKAKLMAKAIDGEVGYWNLRGLSVNVELPHSVEEGDKVKVIVIKED